LKGSSVPAESFQVRVSGLVFTFCKTPIRKVWASNIHAQQYDDIYIPQALLCNSRLVSHERSPSQKAERVGMAIELQQVLQSPQTSRLAVFSDRG
jgi:hypothetical protein